MGINVPCEFLNGTWEIGSHSRARGGCHVSTLFGSGRDNFISIRAMVFKMILSCFVLLYLELILKVMFLYPLDFFLVVKVFG